MHCHNQLFIYRNWLEECTACLSTLHGFAHYPCREENCTHWYCLDDGFVLWGCVYRVSRSHVISGSWKSRREIPSHGHRTTAMVAWRYYHRRSIIGTDVIN